MTNAADPVPRVWCNHSCWRTPDCCLLQGHPHFCTTSYAQRNTRIGFLTFPAIVPQRPRFNTAFMVNNVTWKVNSGSSCWFGCRTPSAEEDLTPTRGKDCPFTIAVCREKETQLKQSVTKSLAIATDWIKEKSQHCSKDQEQILLLNTHTLPPMTLGTCQMAFPCWPLHNFCFRVCLEHAQFAGAWSKGREETTPGHNGLNLR